MPRLVLWIAAVAFVVFGIAFAAFPHQLAAGVDIQLPTDTATTDYVATYGGFQFGFGVFLFLCLRRDDRVRLGLLASACAVTGFAVSRALGILLLGDVRPVLFGVLAFEVTAAAVAFWAVRRLQ